MTTHSRRRRIVRLLPALAAIGLLLGLGLSLASCTTTYPDRNPTGETFPSVVGKDLDEETVRLPEDLAGEPAVILVGYKQRAQFDLDRWLMGLIQAGARGRVIEVPTIPGLVSTIASGWIDDGMRSGIPEEDWGSVVTLYGSSAKPVAKLTGTEGPNARVLVLDPEGRIVWFHDEGYSARLGLEVARLTRELAEGER